MLRVTLSLVLLALCVATIAAQTEPDELLPKNFKKGQVGYLRANGDSSTPYKLVILKVIDKSSLVLLLKGNPKNPFVVRGVVTADHADGQEITLPGLWRVVETTKVNDRTLWVIEPHKDKKK